MHLVLCAQSHTTTLLPMNTLFSIIFVLAAGICVAQSPATIRGKVVDDTKAPQEFVNVVLHAAADSSIVKTELTDKEGKFEIMNMAAGSYFIRTNYIGFGDEVTANFSVKEGQDFTLPTIAMKPMSNEMAEVEVVYKKPLVEVQAEKTVFNVEGTVNAMGLNAMELLRKAPGIMLDNNENISVKGRSGVAVYIDGRISPLNGDGLKAYLKSVPSSDIESIEIITNPSAKYDAAGSAGIINIKLKKNKNFGTNGNLQLGYAVWRYSKYNGSFNINHRTKKWNLFGSYSMNQDKFWSYHNMDRYQDSTRYDQKANHIGSNGFHNYKAGADYYINDKNTIGISLNGNYSDLEWWGDSRTEIYGRNSNDIVSLLNSETSTSTQRNNLRGNLNYQYSDTSGKTFSMDVDYGQYHIRTNTYQPNTYLFAGDANRVNRDYRFITPNDINLVSLKGDYEQKAWGGKIGLGFKSSYVETANTMDRYNIISGADVLDTLLSNHFTYKENINALYTNYNRKFNKIGLQLGLRLEQTVSEGILESHTKLANEQDRNVKRDYINLFPSGAVTYTQNEMNQWALSFSRRIDRPSYQDLNPFEFRLDELSYMKGNPFLQPQFGHVVELTHTYKYMFNTSLNYGFTKDVYASVLGVANDSASYLMQRNLGFEEVMGLNISAPIPVNKWLSIFVNANVGTKRVKADYNDIDIRVLNYSFFGQSTITLPKKYSLEVSGWYSGPSVWGGTFVTKPMGSLDFGAKKTFWNDRASLRLAFSDIFYTSRWTSESNMPTLSAVNRGGWESRQVRVSFSYNFGNQNIKARERKTGADDLNKRVK
jgi:iron complex outermembrane receptor protein